ncbi:glycosyl hydrolase [uncultured Sphingomonas sp.]|uniref:glycosyl hydrolase n=1 Tax=uncultured Sphingomonas sp. TaxID=158754 RepID=UPI0025E3541D|nr:glycosyl hydrolase [uncultured Sphingomonas sp.]
MKPKHRATMLLRCAAGAIAPMILGGTAFAQQGDPLEAGFRTPPTEARPFVWWHWMNGNVTEDGIARDMAWMARAGIGGVQLFEGDLSTPQTVPQRLAWGSPGWAAALRRSADIADRLGLRFGIAASPGWSATGAPFVQPEQAMKKLVWSETRIIGGRPFDGKLAPPPAVAGSFQDIADAAPLAPFYRDVAVLAVPEADDRLRPVAAQSGAAAIDTGRLIDGRFGDALSLALLPGSREARLVQDFGRRVTVRSVTLGVPGRRGFGAPPPADAVLEASDEGQAYRFVAHLPGGSAQVRTAAFRPVSARYFRVRLTVPSGAGLPPAAPGVTPMPAPPQPTSVALSEFALFAHGRVDHAAEKAGFAAADRYAAIATEPAAGDAPIQTRRVLDLTTRLRADGSLDWRPPAGNWTILRLGYALTGHRNGPAPAEATGLEVDKLDAGAVRGYAQTYFAKYRGAVGSDRFGRAGVTALLSDSIESGPQNWTPEMLAAFRQARGYDAVPWLPALTGRIVESAEKTDRFLWDFRQTIAELLARNHYGVLAAAARAEGMTYYAEALEDHRPQLGDDLAMRAPADVPMGALWTVPPGGTPRQTFVADLQGAASVAHTLGKPLVAAETFTAFGAPWAFAPRDLKATADWAFALGVNRIMIHTSPHQPTEDKPGMSLAPQLGQYFSRHETWAEMARGWTDYLARSAYLLQQGRPVADIAYFAGEEAPITGLYGETPVALPPGHGFDFISRDMLLGGLSVAGDGTLVTRGGARYALLELGGDSPAGMTLAALERIAALVEQGATVIGARPRGSPSLADDPARFTALADRLWSSGAGPHVWTDRAAAMRARGLTRDWSLSGADDAALGVVHRQLADGHLYFIANHGARPVQGEMSLRVAGLVPSLWFADTGEIRPVSYRIEGGRTTVALDLAPGDAVLVVLRGRADTLSRVVPAPQWQPLLAIEGSWDVAFPGLGNYQLPARSWTEAPEAALHHYSGTATYRRDVEVPATIAPGSRLTLELGAVGDVARVRIDGRDAGIAWKPPYRLDVTRLLTPGTHSVEVEVANLWVNRLIGTSKGGSQDVYRPDAPLRPSGLMGPVRLLVSP